MLIKRATSSYLLTVWLIGCICSTSAQYVEPVWFSIIEATFVGVNLQRCRKRNGVSKPLGPPSNGERCARIPKTCFFGDQYCPDVGSKYPSVRCICDDRSWQCSPEPCPGSIPPSGPPSTLPTPDDYVEPSSNPSAVLSTIPTPSNYNEPSLAPSEIPSTFPTTPVDSVEPSDEPSDTPTNSPTPDEVFEPSDNPSETPSTDPTPGAEPSSNPSEAPSLSSQPTDATCEYRRKDINLDFDTTEQAELGALVETYVNEMIILEHVNTALNHWSPCFLPWHQVYIGGLESWLLSVGKSEYVPLPKWNPQNPIPDAFFVIDAQCATVVPARRCGMLPPTPTPPLPALPSQLQGSNVCSSGYDNAERLRRGGGPLALPSLEGWHGQIHGGVGGAFGDLYEATHFLLFLLWHAFVDDIYWCYCQCGDCTFECSILPAPTSPPVEETLTPFMQEPPPSSAPSSLFSSPSFQIGTDFPVFTEFPTSAGAPVSQLLPLPPPNAPPNADEDAPACLQEVKRLAQDEIPVFGIDSSSLVQTADEVIGTFGPRESGVSVNIVNQTVALLDTLQVETAALLEKAPFSGFFVDTFDLRAERCKFLVRETAVATGSIVPGTVIEDTNAGTVVDVPITGEGTTTDLPAT